MYKQNPEHGAFYTLLSWCLDNLFQVPQNEQKVTVSSDIEGSQKR